MLYLQDIQIPDNGVFDIQGIQLNFYEAVTGYGESESIGTSVRIKGNQEADYYVGTLSNATHGFSF